MLDATEISKQQEKIKIRIVRRRFRKLVTMVSGFESKEEAKRLGKELKRKLACGGTAKGNRIELQGEHGEAVKATLLKNGYSEEQIDL